MNINEIFQFLLKLCDFLANKNDVFGEVKTLLFIQAINNKEYKVDYSKKGTDLFIRIHQENYI